MIMNLSGIKKNHKRNWSNKVKLFSNLYKKPLGFFATYAYIFKFEYAPKILLTIIYISQA